MPDLALHQWLALCFSALVIGLSKTGIPGAAMLAIPLMAQVFPARASTGLVLPMLVMADAVAVTYYRRQAVGAHLVQLVPWALGGVVVGHRLLGWVSDAQLMPIIGVIVLSMLALNLWRRRGAGPESVIPQDWRLAAAVGLLAGVTTMMANAAGPIMVVYFVAMRLPKIAFVGTSAWFFFALNWFKIPFSADLGLIHRESLLLNGLMLPLIVLGAVLGIALLRRIPQGKFTGAVEILAAVAALRLLWP